MKFPDEVSNYLRKRKLSGQGELQDQIRRAYKQLLTLIPLIDASLPQSILDIGCGLGCVDVLLARLGVKVVHLIPETYAEAIVRELRGHTEREIVYRTKPNRQPLRAVSGAVMGDNRQSLAEALRGAYAVVTVSGGASICALLEGVPAIVLGDGPTMSISSRLLEEIERPRLASDSEREAVLNDLAYHQWRVDEFASGEAWRFLRDQLCTQPSHTVPVMSPAK